VGVGINKSGSDEIVSVPVRSSCDLFSVWAHANRFDGGSINLNDAWLNTPTFSWVIHEDAF